MLRLHFFEHDGLWYWQIARDGNHIRSSNRSFATEAEAREHARPVWFEYTGKAVPPVGWESSD